MILPMPAEKLVEQLSQTRNLGQCPNTETDGTVIGAEMSAPATSGCIVDTAVVELSGIEPLTSSLRTRRSPN